MKKKIKIILLFLSLFTLSGCITRELENYAIVSGLGIDYNDDEYEITMEILKQNEGEAVDMSSIKLSYKGRNISDIIETFTELYSTTPYLNYCSVVIIGDKLAKKGINPLINFMIHYPSIRKTAYLLVAKNMNAKDIFNFEHQSFPVMSLSLQEDLEGNRERCNIWDYAKLYYASNELKNKTASLILPNVYTKDKHIFLKGAAIFSEDKLKLYATEEEVNVIKFIRNTIDKGAIKLDENLSPGIVANNTSLKLINDNVIKVKIRTTFLFYEGKLPYDLYYYDEQVKMENKLKELFQEMIMKIIKRFQNEYKIDPFSIDQYLYRHKPLFFSLIEDDYLKYFCNLNFELDCKISLATNGNGQHTK